MQNGLKGSALQNISKEYIQKIKIIIPPIEKQKEIVKQVETIDNSIKHSKSLIVSLKDEINLRIPENCNFMKLKDISNLIRGPFGSSIRKDIFIQSGYKVYEQKNAIQDNLYIGNYYITKEKYNEMIRFSVKENDLIISCSGTIGKVSIIKKNYEKGIINQALLKITPNEKIYSEYLKILFEYYINFDKR